MRLNADFGERVQVLPQDYQWVPSPMPGVERMMLDRIGDEVARATSLVRYAPNSEFSRHEHGGGEEFLVLDGVFSDEHGDYPAGSYVRNPIGTGHTPRIGPAGCTIFVKLHQFDSDDREQFVIDTRQQLFTRSDREGVESMVLHRFGTEFVALERWAPAMPIGRDAHHGIVEVLVLEGSFRDAEGEFPAGSWIRTPAASEHAPVAGPEGALLYVKLGQSVPQAGLFSAPKWT
jgi:anti-sigma factor ChrR (cupin superfamily)